MNKKQVKVYVAGPYTKGDIAVNVKAAIDVANELASAGFYPFVPHLSHFWHLIHPHPYMTWMELDSAFVKVCDCLLRLRGESRGADGEVLLARELNIPVYYVSVYPKGLQQCIAQMRDDLLVEP